MAKDIFPMIQIVKRIGIQEITGCFESENVKNAIIKMQQNKDSDGKDDELNAIGTMIFFDIASVIISHIADAEAEIYTLLSNLSGMSRKDLENLDIVTFTEMVIDVVKKDEFKDFIGVVIKSLR